MAEMKLEVCRYRKADGFSTRYWAVYLDDQLLAVTLYRKGAQAVVSALRATHGSSPSPTPDQPEKQSQGTAPRANP